MGSNTIEAYSLTTGSDLGVFANTGLNEPAGIAVFQSTLYVANCGNNTIEAFSLTTGSDLGVFANTGLNKPWGVAISPASIASSGAAPTVTNGAATNIGPASATLNGTVDPQGLATAGQFQYGLTTAYGTTVSVTLSPNNGTTAQSVSASLTGLQPGTTYHCILTATNSDGTGTGSDATFTTASGLPVVTTASATGIAATSATLNGTVNPNGLTTTAQFQYGLTTAYGTTVGVTLSPNNGATAQSVSASLTGLQSETTYHYLLTATNSSGSGTGSDATFTTPAPLPVVTTGSATNIATTSATLNGTVNPNGLTTAAQFQYGLTTAYGNTVSVTLSPNNGATAQALSATLAGLQMGTAYHYILTATNSSGTETGSDATFTTLANGASDNFQWAASNGQVTITRYIGSFTSALIIPSVIDGLPVTAIDCDFGDDDGCLSSITIPSSVTSIGEMTFACCALTSVIIPNSVTYIGEGAFDDCPNLTSAVFMGNAPSTGAFAFGNAASNFTVSYFNGATGFTSPTWTDSNGDTYPSVNIGALMPIQTWNYTYFGLGWTNTAISGDSVINNNEGITNLMAYALDANPNTATVSILPIGCKTSVSGTNYLAITFPQNPAATDITYTVQGSSDCSNWSPISSCSNGVWSPSTNVTETSGTTTVQDTTPVSSEFSRFLRLQVTH